MRDIAGKIIYIGKAKDLKKRVASYFGVRPHDPKVSAMMTSVRLVDFVPVPSEKDALILEQKLIHRIKPLYNVMWRDDKSFPFVKITSNEDYPRLLLTRRRKRDGAKYFGPFPDVGSVKRLLLSLWKSRVFPLRPCRYEFHKKDIEADGGLLKSKPSLNRKVQSCLYLHTGACPAPCVGKISSARYLKTAQEAEMFFRGRSKALVEKWEKEMAEASKKMDFERAGDLRDRLAAIHHVSENVAVRQVNEKNLGIYVDISRALTELKEALGLPHLPLRIEGFDISNIQATEPVASLVVYERGKPAKDQYRKFKIKTVRGQNDFAMMGEVVYRRYRRLKEEGAQLPDLILIDGGKGQLGAAVQSLQELNLEKISIASLAKKEEEIFLPGLAQSIRLPKDSPALHILQAVRDEAHRFALSFHRQRRTQRTFSSVRRLL
jgi:excinuclease ABC subunit C